MIEEQTGNRNGEHASDEKHEQNMKSSGLLRAQITLKMYSEMACHLTKNSERLDEIIRAYQIDI
jgi:hypothetical protein